MLLMRGPRGGKDGRAAEVSTSNSDMAEGFAAASQATTMELLVNSFLIFYSCDFSCCCYITITDSAQVGEFGLLGRCVSSYVTLLLYDFSETPTRMCFMGV
jgi:hypothetical protein